MKLREYPEWLPEEYRKPCRKNSKKKVRDIGLNDVDFIICFKGKTLTEYHRWSLLFERCYSPKNISDKLNYHNVEVCKSWLKFSGFLEWLEFNNRRNLLLKGFNLDKDLKVLNSKIYSPETVVLIPSKINSFLKNYYFKKGDLPRGVVFLKAKNYTKPYEAQCSNPITKNYEKLGKFKCPNIAHEVWKNRKLEILKELWDKGYFSEVEENELIYSNCREIILNAT
jgi:hypothetical protein